MQVVIAEKEKKKRLKECVLLTIKENKAVYTTAPVAGGWAGAVMIWARAVMIWARAVMIWAGAVMIWAGACSNQARAIF